MSSRIFVTFGLEKILNQTIYSLNRLVRLLLFFHTLLSTVRKVIPLHFNMPTNDCHT